MKNKRFTIIASDYDDVQSFSTSSAKEMIEVLADLPESFPNHMVDFLIRGDCLSAMEFDNDGFRHQLTKWEEEDDQ